jgi:lysophospholipase L1-like esterase
MKHPSKITLGRIIFTALMGFMMGCDRDITNDHPKSRQQTMASDCPNDTSPALIPAPQLARNWWMDWFRQKLKEPGRESAKLVFLGNSIIQGWESEGRDIWEQFYSHRAALNLGFSGDSTEHVLWRLHNGHIDGMNPELVVVMIGTNNTGQRRDPPEITACAIQLILHELTTRLPDSRILLLAIFPRSLKPDDPTRQLNEEINHLIAGFEDKKTIYYMDINEYFLDERGYLPKEIMPDFLHPNERGYRIWAETMEPMVQKMLQEPKKKKPGEIPATDLPE